MCAARATASGKPSLPASSRPKQRRDLPCHTEALSCALSCIHCVRLARPMVFKFVAHSATVGQIAIREGWLPAARYTNLRDVRRFNHVGFLDIDWRNYQFRPHLSAVRATKPAMTVARDLVRMSDLNRVLDEAEELGQYAGLVIVVPKASRLAE